MANDKNNGKRIKVEEEHDSISKLQREFAEREEILTRDIKQHRLAIEVAEAELVRIRAATKALS